VLRCSLAGDDAGRWRELPAWMLDRASCAALRIEEGPCVDVGALSALTTVLAAARVVAPPVVVSSGPPSSQARVSSAEWTSRNPSRGDIHARPTPSAPLRSSSVRSLRSACAASGAYRPTIAMKLPLDQIVDAHEAQENGKTIGKILIEL